MDHDTLVELGWKRTASGKYTHPEHTVGQQGRHRPVYQTDAINIEKRRERIAEAQQSNENEVRRNRLVVGMMIAAELDALRR